MNATTVNIKYDVVERVVQSIITARRDKLAQVLPLLPHPSNKIADREIIFFHFHGTLRGCYRIVSMHDIDGQASLVSRNKRLNINANDLFFFYTKSISFENIYRSCNLLSSHI